MRSHTLSFKYVSTSVVKQTNSEWTADYLLAMETTTRISTMRTYKQSNID